MTPEEWSDLREKIGAIDERTKVLDKLATNDRVDGIEKRMSSVESELTWAKRGAIASLFTAVVGFFIHFRS